MAGFAKDSALLAGSAVPAGVAATPIAGRGATTALKMRLSHSLADDPQYGRVDRVQFRPTWDESGGRR